MLDFDSYKNSLPYPDHKDPDKDAKRAVYNAESCRLNAKFEEDALAEVGLANHPKKSLIFSRAYADGHAYGYSEVFNKLQDLADFVAELEAK